MEEAGDMKPITAFGPDFPFAYDDWLAHPAGLGSIPAVAQGAEVAIIGGGPAGVVGVLRNGARGKSALLP